MNWFLVFFESATTGLEDVVVSPAELMVDTAASGSGGVSGRSLRLPPTVVFSFEYASSATVQTLGRLESGGGDGPVVWPPEPEPEIGQRQMADRSLGAILEGWSIAGRHALQVTQTRVWSVGMGSVVSAAGAAVPSSQVLGLAPAWLAAWNPEGHYLAAGQPAVEDAAAPAQLSVAGRHGLRLTFAEGRQAAVGLSLGLSGRSVDYGSPQAVEVVPVLGRDQPPDYGVGRPSWSGRYLGGLLQAWVGESAAGLPAITGLYRRGVPALDEAGLLVLDESGDPILEET